MEKKVNVNVLVDDFRHWLNGYMQEDWTYEDIRDCTTDYESVMNDDRELCKFLEAYPKYDMDIIDDNRDKLNEAVLRVAEFNYTNHLLYD